MDRTNWVKGVKVATDVWGNPVGGLTNSTVQPWMQDKYFKLVDSVELFEQVIDACIASDFYSLDTETQGLDLRMYPNGEGRLEANHKIVGFVLCYDGEVGFYIPIRHTSESDDISHPDNGNLPLAKVMFGINRLLAEGPPAVMHNSPYDLEVMFGEGLHVPDSVKDYARFHDTQIEGWLIDSNDKRTGLKSQTAKVLGWKMIEFRDLFPRGSAQGNLRFQDLHPEEAYIYASSDGICTWLLHDTYRKDPILAMQSKVYQIERMLVPVLRRMVRHQFLIDVEYLRELDATLEAKCNEIVSHIKKLCGVPNLNIDSARQLGEVLFEKLKIPNAGKTPSGSQWDTKAATLEALDSEHEGKYPALTMVVKYRQLQKLRGSYLSNLINNVDHLNQARFGIQACGAPTGRFAAPGGKPDQGFSGCNVQSIPKVKKGKPNIRKGFIARPGFVIAAIDFAGVELRIAGNLSNEKKWVDEFAHAECVKKWGDKYEVVNPSPLWHHCPYCHKKVGDIHSQTSMAVFGSAEDPYRTRSKGVNFGILYGAGGKTLARNIGVEEEEGYRIQGAFLEALPQIQAWIRRQHAIAHKHKMVKTAFGRVRLLPEVESDDKRTRSFGERSSVNSPIQGTSADITKLAMVACDNLIESKGWREHCRILLTVHDEIVFEVRDSMKDEIMPALGLVMCKAAPKSWKIPLTVDIEYGPSWGEVIHEWKPEAPRLKALSEDILPLHPGDLFFDGSVMSEDGSSGEVFQPTSVDEASVSLAPPKPAPPEAVEEAAPVKEQVPTLPKETVEEDSGDKEFEFILSRPYSKQKLRKLEALFILAGAGNVRLRLLSDTGKDLLQARDVRVDPTYFTYKAQEWGL